VVVSPGPPELVHVIAGGQLWGSLDGRSSLARRQVGAPTGASRRCRWMPSDAPRVWALVSGQPIEAMTMARAGAPSAGHCPEPDALVRGMAVVDQSILLTTDRGLYRSPDGGEHWQMPSDGLPAHLEAGPIVRDPQSASTIYVGFALTPYASSGGRPPRGSRCSATRHGTPCRRRRLSVAGDPERRGGCCAGSRPRTIGRRSTRRPGRAHARPEARNAP
jgi:hypothetical protein